MEGCRAETSTALAPRLQPSRQQSVERLRCNRLPHEGLGGPRWQDSKDHRRRRSIVLHLPRRNFWQVNRSEEHTSELQSRQYLVCRLLLEKKKNSKNKSHH